MIKTALTTLIIMISIILNGQINKRTSAYDLFSYGSLDLAKQLIDEVAQDESTILDAETWYYRGLIYFEIGVSIDENYRKLDPDPLSIAFISFKKAIELDKKGELSDSIQKYTIAVGEGYFYFGGIYYNEQKYKEAAISFKKAFDAKLSVGQVDTLALNYAAKSAEFANETLLAKDYYLKLFKIGVKIPEVYNDSNFNKLLDYAKNAPESIENKILDLALYLKRPAKDEKEIVEIFFFWIALHIQFDDETIQSNVLNYDHNTKNTLLSKKAICQEFAELLCELCYAVDIECEIILGRTKDYFNYTGERLLTPDHTWNAIKVINKWELIDVTWGSSPGLNLRYLFLDPIDFIEDHFPEDSIWQLIDDPITLDEFYNSKPEESVRGLAMLDTTANLSAYKTIEQYNLYIDEYNHYITITELDNAMISLNNALQINKTDPFIFLQIGNIYNMKGDTANAIRAYENAIRIKSDFFEPYNEIGNLYVREAYCIIDKARYLNKNESDIQKSGADEMMRKSLPYLEKSFDLAPEDEQIIVSQMLEEIYNILGMPEKIVSMNAKLNK